MRQLQLRFVLPLLAVLGLGLFTANRAAAFDPPAEMFCTDVQTVQDHWAVSSSLKQDYRYAVHFVCHVNRNQGNNTAVLSVYGHDDNDCGLDTCSDVTNYFYSYMNFTHVAADVWVADTGRHSAWTGSSYDSYNCIVNGYFQRDALGNGDWTSYFNAEFALGPFTYNSYQHMMHVRVGTPTSNSGAYCESSSANTPYTEPWRYRSIFSDAPSYYSPVTYDMSL